MDSICAKLTALVLSEFERFSLISHLEPLTMKLTAHEQWPNYLHFISVYRNNWYLICR